MIREIKLRETVLETSAKVIVLERVDLRWLDKTNNNSITIFTIMKTPKQDVVQTKNPRTNKYVKIDRSVGRIISQKKTSGPYRGVPVARKKK